MERTWTWTENSADVCRSPQGHDKFSDTDSGRTTRESRLLGCWVLGLGAGAGLKLGLWGLSPVHAPVTCEGRLPGGRGAPGSRHLHFTATTNTYHMWNIIPPTRSGRLLLRFEYPHHAERDNRAQTHRHEQREAVLFLGHAIRLVSLRHTHDTGVSLFWEQERLARPWGGTCIANTKMNSSCSSSATCTPIM